MLGNNYKKKDPTINPENKQNKLELKDIIAPYVQSTSSRLLWTKRISVITIATLIGYTQNKCTNQGGEKKTEQQKLVDELSANAYYPLGEMTAHYIKETIDSLASLPRHTIKNDIYTLHLNDNKELMIDDETYISILTVREAGQKIYVHGDEYERLPSRGKFQHTKMNQDEIITLIDGACSRIAHQ